MINYTTHDFFKNVKSEQDANKLKSTIIRKQKRYIRFLTYIKTVMLAMISSSISYVIISGLWCIFTNHNSTESQLYSDIALLILMASSLGLYMTIDTSYKKTKYYEETIKLLSTIKENQQCQNVETLIKNSDIAKNVYIEVLTQNRPLYGFDYQRMNDLIEVDFHRRYEQEQKMKVAQNKIDEDEACRRLHNETM